MAQATPPQGYYCPMHRAVRQPNPGRCPHCATDLLLEGTAFPMLRYIISNPTYRVIMAALRNSEAEERPAFARFEEWLLHLSSRSLH